MGERVGVFPGSFDPLTMGHYDIVMRALGLFDTVWVAVGRNAEKRALFPVESRLAMARDVFSGHPRVRVGAYDGLTGLFCVEVGACALIRGLRSGGDCEYERVVAQANRLVAPGVETVFLMSKPEHSAITSTVARDLLAHGYEVEGLLPAGLDLSRYERNHRAG